MNSRSPYVTIEAWIKKIGYVPGESIYFNAKIRNCRDKSIRKSYVQLIKVYIFFTVKLINNELHLTINFLHQVHDMLGW